LAAISKCRNAGIPEKSWSGIGIFIGNQISQSGIGNSGIMVSPVPLVTDYSGIAQFSNIFTEYAT
jgi:hypothetical protein